MHIALQLGLAILCVYVLPFLGIVHLVRQEMKRQDKQDE